MEWNTEMQLDILKKISHAKSGQVFSFKILKIKEHPLLGSLILMDLFKIWLNINQMLLAGMNTMVFGQVKPLLFSLLTQDGFI
jgi:hypothetical protein